MVGRPNIENSAGFGRPGTGRSGLGTQQTFDRQQSASCTTANAAIDSPGIVSIEFCDIRGLTSNFISV